MNAIVPTSLALGAKSGVRSSHRLVPTGYLCVRAMLRRPEFHDPQAPHQVDACHGLFRCGGSAANCAARWGLSSTATHVTSTSLCCEPVECERRDGRVWGFWGTEKTIQPIVPERLIPRQQLGPACLPRGRATAWRKPKWGLCMSINLAKVRRQYW